MEPQEGRRARFDAPHQSRRPGRQRGRRRDDRRRRENFEDEVDRYGDDPEWTRYDHKVDPAHRIQPEPAFEPSAFDGNAIKVIRRLHAFGYPAYLVGGCVRDLLLGVTPKDFDIATAATPRQVKRLFRNSRVIGRRFRLAHISFGRQILEVSTFRAQAPPQEGDDLLIRRDNVFGTPEEDARRRDFTINGLFLDIRDGTVIDFVDGMADVRRRLMQTIGDPLTRFAEDPVRMLRAVKFAGRLGFRLADDVRRAIVELREDLHKSPAPRVLEEINRLMDRGGAHDSLRILWSTGLLRVVLPEVADWLDARHHEDPECLAFWSAFRVIDEFARVGEPLSTAIRHSFLFGPLFRKSVEAATGSDPTKPWRGDLGLVFDDALRTIAMRLHMPRRDVSLTKHILIAQERLFRPGVRRRRTAAMDQVVRRDYFRDALRHLEIRFLTTGAGEDALREWTDRLRAAEDGWRHR